MKSYEAKEFCIIALTLLLAVFVMCILIYVNLDTHTDQKQNDITAAPTPTPEIVYIYKEIVPMVVEVVSPTPEPTVEVTPSPTPMEITPPRVSVGYSKGVPGFYRCEVNGKHGFKPYTDYTAYTSTSSQQYKLQQIAKTDYYGLRTVVDPFGVTRWCVALGTAWAGGTPTDIGRCVDIHMRNGSVLHVVLADVKRVEDSYSCLYGRTNNDLIEFIVETPKLVEKARVCGNISYCNDIFMGEGESMEVFDYFIEGFGE